jgi:hypothetical protein
MTRWLLIAGFCALLAGCANESVDLEAEFAERCAAVGYAQGTPEFAACVDLETQSRLVRHAAGRLD